MWIYAIIFALLVTLSAAYSASEMSYNVVNRLRLKKAAEQGNKAAKRALKIAETHDETVSTILFGNNLVNIAASSIATLLGMHFWGETYGPSIGAALSFAIILIFGELLPKATALRYSYRWSLFFGPFITFFKILFKPFVFVISHFVHWVSRLWTKRAHAEKPVTDDELVEMVDNAEESGVFDEKQGELLRSAIDFTETSAFEVMTPRVDLFAFDIQDSPEELLRNPNLFTHSRIPVYEETIDNIIGILPTKLLLKAIVKGEKIDIRSNLVDPIYVYRTKPISAILTEFKATHQHIAVVKDEFGGTEGIITMEDIVEELVGDIWDETDVIEEDIKKISDDEYLVSGAMNIDDFFDEIGYEKDFDSDYTTVGGWCQERLERFAKVGDVFSFADFDVEVLEADEFTVSKVRVTIRHPLNEDEE